MPQVSRRAILVASGAGLLGASIGCVPQQPVGASVSPVAGERFPLPAAASSGINPAFLRTRVAYAGSERPGTIVIDPGARYLYAIDLYDRTAVGAKVVVLRPGASAPVG